MRTYERVTVTEERERLVETVCDLCGTIAKRGCYEASTYEVKESEIKVMVRYKEGVSYPDSGIGTEYVVDMCPECFKTKLIPWLESQGCTAKTEEWNF